MGEKWRRRDLEREGELENENGKNETVEVEEWKEQNIYTDTDRMQR